ncbi:hypothetical protein DB347_15065 [Opitutaceae bacterium EW11]|nr:hypothetical protein DB347_15065 [Opitutaceae bacterium EW11]
MLVLASKARVREESSAMPFSFAIAPLLDAPILPERYYCIRHFVYLLFSPFAALKLASLLGGFVFVGLILIPLIVCYRRRWFLKL